MFIRLFLFVALNKKVISLCKPVVKLCSGFWTGAPAQRERDADWKVHSSHLVLRCSSLLILLCICYVKQLLAFRSRTHCCRWGCPCHLTGWWVSFPSPPLWMASAKGSHLKRHHNYFTSLLILSRHSFISCCTPTLAQCQTSLCKCTWTAFQFKSRLDGGDGGDNGPIWHDGSVHIDFLGGGEWGTKWQSIGGAARLLCFHIKQLEESKKQ